MVAVIGHRTLCPWPGENESVLIAARQVFGDRELLLRGIRKSWCAGRQHESTRQRCDERFEQRPRGGNDATGFRHRLRDIGRATGGKRVEARQHSRLETQIGIRKRRSCVADVRESGEQRLEGTAAPRTIETRNNQDTEMQSRSVVPLRKRQQAEARIDRHYAI